MNVFAQGGGGTITVKQRCDSFGGQRSAAQRGDEIFIGHVIIGFVAFLAADSQAAVAVVGKAENQGLAVFFGKVQCRADRVGIGDGVADDADGIIGMRGPVYLAGFHEKEKAFRVLGQRFNGFGGHFR